MPELTHYSGDTATWQPDILGEGYEQLTLELPSGAPATLVRYSPPGGCRPDAADVLYVHGWSDYFFQTELAQYWAKAGMRFYALDLHNYGRSLRPGQSPGFTMDLTEYDDDIAAALAAMGRPVPAVKGETAEEAKPARPLILVGHSTGGLTLSLWAARHPLAASALVLNSPWLEFQATELGRKIISPLIGREAQRHPLATLPPVDAGNYSRAVFSAFGGEWTYNLLWRPLRGFPGTVAFLNAVFRAQAAVADGLDLGIPVLVLLSDKSYLQPRWSAEAGKADVALDVEVVAHRALSLGNSVTVARVPDALHDVFLSAKPVRRRAYAAVDRWARGYLPAAPKTSPELQAGAQSISS
ncbi:alpha/beta hydrolase [Arthrobacter gengyunqii]|uniref:Alpha/beta hydrolase n=1 Tax=Arthrobacter gengyunqii TaxID=2886940 RepID=A0A9X1S4V6_9MICC|nr:alpha/beta hydrolase [Arthrobacter gengyunqii]MCC3268705.1 alpha/beta hydrolase [Arthrobacter gengyunqii]UOY96090.1 alpha/beta hydrolase [Arthrobacter gengyunqii]